MKTNYKPKHRAEVPVDTGTWAVLIKTGFDTPWVVLSHLPRAEAAAEVRNYEARGITAWAEDRP